MRIDSPVGRVDMKGAGGWESALRNLALCLILVTGPAACGRDETVPEIDMSQSSPVPVTPEIRIAVGGMITPKEGFVFYRRFLDYLGGKLGRPVRYVDRQDYAELNLLLKSGEVDAAFVCSGPYVQGKDDFGLDLLAVPVAYGAPVYYSYIIVNSKSAAKSLNDLKGGTFAFTDPLSNTGRLVPTYMLAQMGEKPESFFGKIVYTKFHDRSIEAVAQGAVDGAAVDSLIWEYAKHTNPSLASRTRVIVKSPPYAIPPFVVRPGLDPVLREKLLRVLLSAHEDRTGREILTGMMIDRFVVLGTEAYDSIREMDRFVKAMK
jgi:phosphonate transport system substrate-binding protein